MSSVASQRGYPVFFAYSAAKGEVRAMTKAIATHCQMCGYDIRVNSIHPAAIDTPMIDQTSSDLAIEDKSGLSPVGLGSPLDVASVVLFLASGESRFVIGSEIVLDNALTIQSSSTATIAGLFLGSDRDFQAIEFGTEFDLATQPRVGFEILEFFQQFFLVLTARRQASNPRIVDENVAGGTGTDAAANRLDAVIEVTQ
jgi:hypothetical protein